MHLIIHLMYPVYIEPFRASEISYFLYCNYATFHSLPLKLPRRLSKVTSPHNTLLSSKSVFLSYTTTLFNLPSISEGCTPFSIYRSC